MCVWFGLWVGDESVWVVDGKDVEDVFPVGGFSCEVFASWLFFLGCGVQDFEGCLFGWEVSPLSCCSTEPGVEGLDRVGGRDQRVKLDREIKKKAVCSVQECSQSRGIAG